MNGTISLSLELPGNPEPIQFNTKGAVVCGYTGRNQEAVRQHIEELLRQGIAAPPSVPTFYPKPPHTLAVTDEIHVEGVETSGEVEFFIISNGDDVFIGLGSDHTDRGLEKLDILKSKQVCPAVMSRQVWKYDDIKEHLDQIMIRSRVILDGKAIPYQEATLASILSPPDLMDMVDQRVNGTLDGIVIFSGTPPLLTGEMVFAGKFEAEMHDPVLGRTISLGYEINTMDWFKRDSAG